MAMRAAGAHTPGHLTWYRQLGLDDVCSDEASALLPPSRCGVEHVVHLQQAARDEAGLLTQLIR